LVVIVVAVVSGCIGRPKASDADSRPGDKATRTVTSTAPALSPPNPDKNAYFGDLHLHTSYSMDAFAFTTRTTPADSFKYAMGEEVEYLGKKVRRHAPLDFLAVTDHAEYLGVVRQTIDPKGPFAASEWHTMMTSQDPQMSGQAFKKLIGSTVQNQPIPELNDPTLVKAAWDEYAKYADEYYRPGRLTTFVGFEWTSAPQFQNLHRCVIFKDEGPATPFSAFDSEDPEKLWAWMDAQRQGGRDVIAIPHNGNVSNGMMFDAEKTFTGKPLTRDYAERRMSHEPAFEIIQGKGQSETHPALSTTDELASFEMYTKLLATSRVGEFRKGSYLRQAYGTGMALQRTLGANPFKYGIVAGTDYHSGISATEEDNYVGSHGNQDADPKLVLEQTESVGGEAPSTIGAGGLTGVWAEQNTRAAIFASLQRKETFGTSGNRIAVRLFAGWRYPTDLLQRADWVTTAYATGVPMGATLAAPAGAKAPTFLVQARKDPAAAHLDRIQIIKVSLHGGKSREDIFDVAWSGDRKRDAKTGKLPPVGSTVDVAAGTYANTIGAAILTAAWVDPQFDPHASATYYARVLEIPTPRWSTIWAAQAHVPRSTVVPAVIQERAWTSPIFYEP